MPVSADERQPLLSTAPRGDDQTRDTTPDIERGQGQGQDQRQEGDRGSRSEPDAESESDRHMLSFEDDDPGHPRNWPRRCKMANVAVISSMSLVSPLAAAAFTPAITAIADDLGVEVPAVIAATSGYVVMLGVGPLILAPLSETFGRRAVYLVTFVAFTLLQLPTALAPDVETLVAVRTVQGFFAAVGVANGGGTISDMFHPGERAAVFGVYLLGLLAGPALGPVLGGVVVQFGSWRAIFWAMLVLSAAITASAFAFLRESYAPAILAGRKRALEKEHPGSRYGYEGEDERPMRLKLAQNLWRPLVILATQPIVVVMASYQAVIWSTQFSLLTQFDQIFGNAPYGFEPYQVGLTYLPMGAGFGLAAWLIIPRIDTVYNRLAEKHGGRPRPEYRLPLANIGAVAVPASLFALAWMVERRLHWSLILVLLPFGVGQVCIFNCAQNYYIDSFEKYAASAIAAGSLFRSIVGGSVPLLVPSLVDEVGYGWGISIFAFASLLLAPAPLVFYRYGPALRERYKIDL